MKNLSILEPQTEKHHAYKKKHVLVKRKETNNMREFIKVKKCTFYRLIPNFLSSRENFEEESTRIILDVQSGSSLTSLLLKC